MVPKVAGRSFHRWRTNIVSMIITSTWFGFSLNILYFNSSINLLFCVLSIVPSALLNDSGVGVRGNGKISALLFFLRAKKKMLPKSISKKNKKKKTISTAINLLFAPLRLY